jgi:hypothetical protein
VAHESSERIHLYLVEDVLLTGDPVQNGTRAFTSFELAFEYVENCMLYEMEHGDGEPSPDPYCRYVIRKMGVNVDMYPAKVEHAWEFSNCGDLLREVPEITPPVTRSRVKPKFSPGDLITILSRLDEPDSPMIAETQAVLIQENSNSDGETNYRVHAIHDYGHLIELSVPQHCLRPLTTPIHARSHFLNVYTMHLKGVNPLPESVTRLIRPGDRSIIVGNFTHYDFTANRLCNSSRDQLD